MRRRLADLIQIAAANGTHLPVRHLLLLIANLTLGVSGKSAPLMTCATAHALAEEGEPHLSDPFDNALGLNLPGSESRDYLAFRIVADTGLGKETNNAIDALLLDQDPPELHRDHVARDAVHGASLFETERRAYRRGELDDAQPLLDAMARQRRRLFFVLPPAHEAGDPLDPWALTVYRHGGQYLAFWRALLENRPADHARRRLVIGLNRSYAGLMCDDDGAVWFTAPAANTQSRLGNVLDARLPLGDRRGELEWFDFTADGPSGRPRMVVMARASRRDAPESLVENDLPPHLFEYLMRVEAGSLPGSFSRQCFEELRHFRLRVTAALARNDVVDPDALEDLRVVGLGSDGRLEENDLGLVLSALGNAS